MKRRFAILAIILALFGVASFAIVNTAFVQSSYHQWRMNVAYNTLFGNPQPAGNGLAAYDVTGVDVDGVMAAYNFHRNELVELNVLTRLHAEFPNLASDGTDQQSDARSAFAHRMWKQFPSHRHYYLAGNGSFETYVPVTEESDWDRFIKSELTTSRN